MIAQKSISTDSEHVLNRIEGDAKVEFLPIIGPDKGKLLVDEVRKAKPKRVLEVGTLVGYSAVLIGKELGSDAELVTIEIHPDEAEEAKRNVVAANITAKVTIITGDALKVIPSLEGKFDFAFIDAEKTEYLKYLKLAEPKLCKGAVVFADNAGMFAARMVDYLNYVKESGRYISRYVQIGDDGVEISEKLF